jgi:hypothetical protein
VSERATREAGIRLGRNSALGAAFAVGRLALKSTVPPDARTDRGQQLAAAKPPPAAIFITVPFRSWLRWKNK